MPRRHPRISAALQALGQAALAQPCGREPPALFRQGIAEFNCRQFFEQHETLEELWRAERGPIRYLYQGILQIGVGFLHLGQGNFHGAVVKLENGLALLSAFEPRCLGVDVVRLVREARACLEALHALGPRGLDAFDRRMIPTVHLLPR